MEMTHWYWCSVGFRPKDVANGKCKKFNKLPFGCHSCSDWKLMDVEEIIRGSNNFRKDKNE